MSIERTILLTGFEPFGGETINPSQEIVRALDGEHIEGHRVIGAILPVVFAPTLALLESLLHAHHPALAVGLGQAGGRSGLAIERVAINLIDARIADNEGVQPLDEPIAAGATGAYFSTLPVKAMAARLSALGIPASVSLSAGSFVCNQAFFVLAHLIADRHAGTGGGFIHVPWLPEQAIRNADQPSMTLETMVEGVRAALACAILTPHDVRTAGGEIH
ncbi:MAG: pyroglutamyl-peptidase I [Dokdonella sp.]|uniref:pyroglutamyl-peptidase I n=1 Tax=Dokdonella sp. TaxID=2291710 RepID=UPI003263124F